jgi:hypothetical protein
MAIASAAAASRLGLRNCVARTRKKVDAMFPAAKTPTGRRNRRKETGRSDANPAGEPGAGGRPLRTILGSGPRRTAPAVSMDSPNA